MKRIFAILILAISILSSFSTPSYAADTIPPKLVDWALQRLSVDISKSSASLSVKFVISDENRVNQPKLLVQSLTTSQKSGYALVQELGKSGNLTAYEATVTIDFGSANGEWEWVLLPLSDSLGNTNNLNGPEINWVKKFNVFDSSYTSETYGCILRVQRFNKSMNLIKDFQKDYPERVSLIILKYSIPKNFLFDEKLCLADPNLGGLYLDVDGLMSATESLLAFAESDKAAADKAAADKAAAEINQKRKELIDVLSIKLSDLMLQFPDFKKVMLNTQNSLNYLNDSYLFLPEQEFIVNLASIKKQIEGFSRLKMISCVKGKLSKTVSGNNPKCPAGYKVKK